MLKKLDHIGIAVANLDAATDIYRGLTGKEPSRKEVVEAHHVDTAFFDLNGVRLELLKGTHASSAISKFVEKRGEGIHHLCFEVDNLNEARHALEQVGFRFIEKASEAGASGSRVAFMHPKSTGGVLLELVEHPKRIEDQS